MRRRLLNLVTALSLGASVLAAAMWVRSRPMMRLDSVSRGFESYDFSAISGGGRFAVIVGSWPGKAQTYPWEWQHDAQTYGFQPAYPPDRTLLGLGWRTRYWMRRDPPVTMMTSRVLIVPYWQLVLLGATLPAWRLVSWARRRRRRRPGHCPRCGYDLRASNDRCPECGAPTALAGVPAGAPATPP